MKIGDNINNLVYDKINKTLTIPARQQIEVGKDFEQKVTRMAVEVFQQVQARIRNPIESSMQIEVVLNGREWVPFL